MNVKANDVPAACAPDAYRFIPVASVAVCETPPLKLQVTVPPTLIVAVAGWNWKSMTEIAAFLPRAAADAADGSPTSAGAAAASRRRSERTDIEGPFVGRHPRDACGLRAILPGCPPR